jgi:dihydroxyacid dehydratase (EC 4.2.1.9)
VELVRQNIRPLDFINEKSFENAITMDMLIGGSTNTVLHLPAVAREAGIKLGLDKFDEISRKTPHIVSLDPASRDTVVDLDESGGVPMIIKKAKKFFSNEMTVSGKRIFEIAEMAVLRGRDIVMMEKPYRSEGGIAILKGNIAEKGAVVKASAVREDMLRFSEMPKFTTARKWL